MPEIIDVLTEIPADCPGFVANNATDFVLSAYPGGATNIMKNADGHGTFAAGDNFTILAAGYILPESYTLWKNRADLATDSIQAANFRLIGKVSGDLYTISGLGSAARLYYPLENYEHEFDIFISTPEQNNLSHPPAKLTESFYLSCLLAPMNISQRGQPAAFNGKTFVIVPFLKIAHNLPLTV